MKFVALSDAHFGSDLGRFPTKARVRIFNDFLEFIKLQGFDELILVGDIFDFWFEYKHVIPKEHFEVLEALHSASNHIKIRFIGGNHDLWADGFLEELGISVHEDPFEMNVDGRRILFAHGDKFRRTDLGGRIVRFILGNALAISMFRLVHPDIGISIAHWVSSSSRKRSSRKTVQDPVPEKVVELLSNGYDLVVSGHVHLPFIQRVGNGIFAITGDWLYHFTYLEFEDGKTVKIKWYLEEKEQRIDFE